MFLDQNFTVKLTIGKINRKDWTLFDLNQLLVKLAPGSPQKMSKKTPILEIFRTISPKQAWWPPNFFTTNFSYELIQLHVQKIIENSEC